VTSFIYDLSLYRHLPSYFFIANTETPLLMYDDCGIIFR